MPSSKSTNAATQSQPISLSSSISDCPFYSAYSLKSRSSISFPAEGRTKQSFAQECDINTIMSRYALTGQFTHLSLRAPQYGDVADIDFQGCMDTVAAAREHFASLPSAIRDRFHNDPGRLLSFLQDPSNRDEALKLGLLAPSEAPPLLVPIPQAAPLPSTPPNPTTAATA